MTREEALEEIKEPPYDAKQLKIDKEFVLKKLGLSEAEFDAIMQLPIRNHREFEMEGSLFYEYPILKPFRPIWNAIKTVAGK